MTQPTPPPTTTSAKVGGKLIEVVHADGHIRSFGVDWDPERSPRGRVTVTDSAAEPDPAPAFIAEPQKPAESEWHPVTFTMVRESGVRCAATVITVDAYARMVAAVEAARAYVAYGRKTFGYRPGSAWLLNETHDLVAAVDALDTAQPTRTEHRYLSTGCLHGRHDYCAKPRLNGALKAPAQCKLRGRRSQARAGGAMTDRDQRRHIRAVWK